MLLQQKDCLEAIESDHPETPTEGLTSDSASARRRDLTYKIFLVQ